MEEFFSGGIGALLDSSDLDAQFMRALQAAYEVVDRGTKLDEGEILLLSQKGLP